MLKTPRTIRAPIADSVSPRLRASVSKISKEAQRRARSRAKLFLHLRVGLRPTLTALKH